MDLVWFAITPHVPVLSPACKLLPSKESSSVLGDGAPPIGQEASSAGKRKALLSSFPFLSLVSWTLYSLVVSVSSIDIFRTWYSDDLPRRPHVHT